MSCDTVKIGEADVDGFPIERRMLPLEMLGRLKDSAACLQALEGSGQRHKALDLDRSSSTTPPELKKVQSLAAQSVCSQLHNCS